MYGIGLTLFEGHKTLSLRHFLPFGQCRFGRALKGIAMSRNFAVSAVLLASASAFVLGTTGALAAEQGIETVVVTAEKRSEPIEKTPISIKAISGAELNEINADSAQDYLRSVPSVSILARAIRRKPEIQIRGLGSDVSNVGTITVYNDGVVSPSQENQASGAYSEEDPGLYDMRDIEVLRGPQGTLYGEGSLGGVINIKSNRPDLNDYQASASVSVVRPQPRLGRQ